LLISKSNFISNLIGVDLVFDFFEFQLQALTYSLCSSIA
jgi:hypothetical protein